MFGNDINHQRIPDKSDQHDEREEERDQPGVGQERMLVPFLLLSILRPHPSGDVGLGDVDPQLLGGVPELAGGGGGGVHGVGAERGMGGECTLKELTVGRECTQCARSGSSLPSAKDHGWRLRNKTGGFLE